MTRTRTNNRRYLANLGDASPLDYGAAIIYQDGKDTRMLYWDSPVCRLCGNEDCNEHYGTPGIDRYEMRAWDIEPDVSRDLTWVDWAEVARADGGYFTVADLTSPDVRIRGMAYLAVGNYYGFDNLDAYPVEMSRSNLWRYHGSLLRAIRREIRTGHPRARVTISRPGPGTPIGDCGQTAPERRVYVDGIPVGAIVATGGNLYARPGRTDWKVYQDGKTDAICRADSLSSAMSWAREYFAGSKS